VRNFKRIEQNMKFTIAISMTFLLASSVLAQGNVIEKNYKKNISFIRLDSTYKAQSTVIEYDNFLVLLELPAIEKSLYRKNGLDKETEQGQILLDYLKAKFDKPVKYVFSSHSHLHTLSGILPFLQTDSKIVTTTHNWETCVRNRILSSEQIGEYLSNIITVDKDTTFFKNSDYPIELVYLDSSDVYYTPTDDYLMFYLKKDKILHASCTAWIKDIDYKKLKNYTYNSRLDGLFRAIKAKDLNPKTIIRLEHNTLNNPNNVEYAFSVKEIKQTMSKAITTEELKEHLSKIVLTESYDSLINYAITIQLHPNLIRITALQNLEEKRYAVAIKLATFLNLYFPGSPRYIDVLGECYFASGDYEKALYYDNHLHNFSENYGIDNWKNRKWDE
jgi:tetratricopeptide (TPR) repeat protein